MRVVIDIDDKVYEDSKKLVEYGFGSLLYVEAIANGTPYEERLKGEWGDVFHHMGYNYHKCSKCFYAIRLSDYDEFCPNCGADMRGDVWNGKKWAKEEGDV